jgi:hypothetical protein
MLCLLPRATFDAVLSFDAYHYFWATYTWLSFEVRSPGGRLAIAVPGLVRELPEGPPETLRPYWEWDFCSFHSPEWWRKHWAKTGLVEIEVADSLANGWRLWAQRSEWCAEVGAGLVSVAAREGCFAWIKGSSSDSLG